MPEQWYESVSGEAALLQGDFILDCYLLDWKPETPVLQALLRASPSD